MKILRERPDQRRHHRVTAPLNITLGDYQGRADDWSIGGVKLSGFEGPLPKLGEELPAVIKLPFQGFDIGFTCPLKIVRTDEATGLVAGKFTDLGEREQDLMEHFIEDLIRGHMTETRDTIQRIDVPITPISTKPDIDPGLHVPIKRWSRRTIIMSLFYLISGISIFTYLALLLYTNFIRLEVDSAVLTRPVVVSKAMADGAIAKHHFAAGQSVKRGSLITELSIPELEQEKDEARVQLLRQRGAATRAQKALSIAKRMEAPEAKIETLRVELMKQKTELKAAKLRLHNLDKARNRLFVKSPYDGKIVSIHKPEGSTVLYKEPLLAIELAGAPQVKAFLTQEEILKIGLNDEAIIYVPSLKFKTKATIVSINRTSHNLNEADSSYIWQAPNAKSAHVVLEIMNTEDALDWPAGLPVTVLFNRHKDKTPVLTGTSDA